jgi:probable rRNA maturation factor
MTTNQEWKRDLRKINIHNAHPSLKVKKTPIRLLVKTILNSENAEEGLDVIFVDDESMIRLNREFTRRDQTTDVLSFGMREGSSDPVEYPNLGDVYVSLDQAKRQAEARQAGLEDEVALLVTHGVLHLLGYDHQEKSQKLIMRRKEQSYLKSLKEVTIEK